MFCNRSFSYFLKLLVKQPIVVMNIIISDFTKMVQEIITPSNHVIVRTGFILRGPLALWGFSNIFLLNVDKDQKSHHLSAEPLALCHMANPALVIALRS